MMYNTGTVQVTNGSPNLIGTGTTWTAAMVGQIFSVLNSNVWYTVASFTDATHIALAANYQGTSGSGKSYVIHQSFTLNFSLPYLESGDVQAAAVLGRAINMIDREIMNSRIGRIIKQSSVQVVNTGNTAETVLATIPIPADAIGKNGKLRITATFTYTNGANNKTFRMRYGAGGGGVGGTLMGSGIATTTELLKAQLEIGNRNATNSQVGTGNLLSTFDPIASPAATSAIDTTVATEVVITGQLANSADTLRLESYTVELIREPTD